MTKRFHNSRKLIISKLKELNDTNHGEEEASSDDAKPNSSEASINASKVLVMQLDILKNDLLTIYNDVTPCCPAQFDIYQLLKLYCNEYDKLFLRSNIIENLEDLNVLQIMKLIDRLRHFTYKAYEVESVIRSNDRKSHKKDSDNEKGLLPLVENSSQSIITGEISDLQGINEVLSKLILQHKMSIRNQMNTFIEIVASKK